MGSGERQRRSAAPYAAPPGPGAGKPRAGDAGTIAGRAANPASEGAKWPAAPAGAIAGGIRRAERGAAARRHQRVAGPAYGRSGAAAC